MKPTVLSYKPGVGEAIRVVNALMLREIKTRFGEHHLGFAWLFIEPLLFVVPVVLFWTLRSSTSHGLPIAEWIMTGYPPFVMWRNCVTRARGAISGNNGLLYHRMITPTRIVLARCLVEVAASFLSSGLVYVGLLYMGWVRPPAAFPFFLFGWLYMAVVSWASALLLSALAEMSKTLSKIIATVSYLMLAVGGAFFMVEWMPRGAQAYLVWLPTVQGFELIRFGYFGDVPTTHWSVFHMIVCALVPAVLGLQLMKFAREHMELE